MRDAGLVLNFEARGHTGRSAMFETTAGNGRLVRELGRAAPYPDANSLSYEIYQRLPNNSDLTVFREAGVPGMNFAYLGGVTHYHTRLDLVANVDRRSLQHHGAFALSLARHFGDLPLDDLRDDDAVYFNSPVGGRLVQYPVAWALPLAGAVALLFLAVVVLGVRKGRLSLRGALFGWLALLPGLVGGPLVALAAWQGARALHPEYGAPFVQSETYNSHAYLAGFVALTLAVTAAGYVLARRRSSSGALAVGALAWWLALLGLTSVALPGASFLFAWPLLASFLALGWWFAVADGDGGPGRAAVWLGVAVLAAGALPGIGLHAPLVPALAAAAGPDAFGSLMVLVVLLVGLLLPQLEAVTVGLGRGRWALAGGAWRWAWRACWPAAAPPASTPTIPGPTASSTPWTPTPGRPSSPRTTRGSTRGRARSSRPRPSPGRSPTCSPARRRRGS